MQVIVVIIIFAMDRQGVVQFIPPTQGEGCGQGVQRGIYSRFITVDCQHKSTAESEAAVIHVDDSSVSNGVVIGALRYPFSIVLELCDQYRDSYHKDEDSNHRAYGIENARYESSSHADYLQQIGYAYRYSGFEVTCPDCDLKSALNHAERDRV